MDYFPWKEEYSVGNFEIDSQHRRLVAILNRLNSAIWEEASAEITNVAIADLIDYTLTHFKFEEALLERSNYPELKAHRILHAKLAEEVSSYKSDIDHKKSINALELIPFLRDWLSHHIQKEDKAYAHHLSEYLE